MATLASVRVCKKNIQVIKDGDWYTLWFHGNEYSRSMSWETTLNSAKNLASGLVAQELDMQLANAFAE
jgi:hypothetical protein